MKELTRKIFIALIAVCFFTGCKKESNSNPPPPIDNHDTTALKNIGNKTLIGSYINNDFSNTKYVNIIRQQFNCGQSLFYAGFGGWQSRYYFGYDATNAVINWMVANGISPHVHMLVGPDNYMPDWLLNGTWTNDELDTMMKDLIYTTLDTNDNKNKVDVWNVVNEVFNDDGTYRSDIIWNRLGWEADASGLSGADKINNEHPVFLRKAFQYARDKTTKKLEYRDFNNDNNNPVYGWDKKYKAIYQWLNHAQASGIPLDAVGIQGHLDIGNINWLLENNSLITAVQQYKALGIEVYITELDIGTAGNTWNSSAATQQKTDYYNYISQALKGGVSRIYTWGIQDGYDKGWRTSEHPLPWDESLEKKEAYYGIQQALKDNK